MFAPGSRPRSSRLALTRPACNHQPGVKNVIAQCKCNSPRGNPHECNDCGSDDDGEDRYLGYWGMTQNLCYQYCRDEFGDSRQYSGFYYGLEWKGECYCA